MHKHTLKNNKGLGLVEVIAALGISVVVITALVSLALFTMRTSLQSTQLMNSTKVVNEQLELVRTYRDSNTWVDFTAGMEACRSLTKGCKFTSGTTTLPSATTLKTYSELGATELYVYFQAQNPENSGATITSETKVVRVSVYAKWLIGKDAKQTSLYTDYTNWQNK